MNNFTNFSRIVGLTLATIWSCAFANAQAASGKVHDFEVDAVKRQAIIVAPQSATSTPSPLVFAFHGHGGSGRQYLRSAAIHEAWPEAIVVYPDGLPTPGMTDPKGEKAGWEKNATDQGGRDLKFFDAMLAWLKSNYKVDAERIYSTGHSNGGGFTYLLWAERPSVFAAMGPSSAGPNRSSPKLTPKPAIHIAGKDDTIVPFAIQERVMTMVRKVNACSESSTPWDTNCALYESTSSTPASGAPFVACIHPGSHKYYDQATRLIVKFFKEHPKPAPSPVTPAPAPAGPTAPAPAPAPTTAPGG